MVHPNPARRPPPPAKALAKGGAPGRSRAARTRGEIHQANILLILEGLMWQKKGSMTAELRMFPMDIVDAIFQALHRQALSPAQAREIEWTMQRPHGWLDIDHRHEPLDQ